MSSAAICCVIFSVALGEELMMQWRQANGQVRVYKIPTTE
jgi:hypothetical protein